MFRGNDFLWGVQSYLEQAISAGDTAGIHCAFLSNWLDQNENKEYMVNSQSKGIVESEHKVR
jgi:hypothetical protein